tara:strand:- start:618 stop:1094 length:477 start_codon:yes stop_codon:yes gene_type:complete
MIKKALLLLSFVFLTINISASTNTNELEKFNNAKSNYYFQPLKEYVGELFAYAPYNNVTGVYDMPERQKRVSDLIQVDSRGVTVISQIFERGFRTFAIGNIINKEENGNEATFTHESYCAETNSDIIFKIRLTEDKVYFMWTYKYDYIIIWMAKQIRE